MDKTGANIDMAAAAMLENQAEGKLWTGGFIKITAINFLLFFSFQMLLPTFPLYLKSLGGTDMIVGIAAALFSAAALLSKLGIGWLLDNKSRRTPFIAGLIVVLICPVSFIVITPMLWILVLRFIHGFGFSMSTTASSTNASDILPAAHFSEGLGIFAVSSSISLSVAPACGIFITQRFGFQILFLASFLVAVSAFILTLRFPTRQIVRREKQRFSWKNDIINGAAIPASVTMFFAILPYGAINNFVSLYALDKGFTNVGGYFILLAISTIAFRLSTGRLIDKKGVNLMFFISLPAFFVSLLLLAVADREGVFLLSAVLFGIGFGGITPVLMTKALKAIPLTRRGSANSTFFLSFDLGIGLGGLIAGAISDTVGYSHMYLYLLASYLISFLLYMALLYQNKVKESPD